MCKTVGSGVGLELHKPWPPLKKLLDLGWETHTWRITALGGGWDTDCPRGPGMEMIAKGGRESPSWEPKLPSHLLSLGIW